MAARLSVSGARRGKLTGLAPIGKRVKTSDIAVFRFEGGKLTEHRAAFDAVGMQRQIGLRPGTGPALRLRTLVHGARRRLPMARSPR